MWLLALGESMNKIRPHNEQLKAMNLMYTQEGATENTMPRGEDTKK